jgi:hypothetical protein
MNELPEMHEAGLAAALENLKSVLIADESLEVIAVQRRLFSLTHRRLLIAATSGRLICITRGLVGGFSVVGLRWQDLEGVTLRVGILAADLRIQVGSGADLAIEGKSGSHRLEFTGLRKHSAQAVYRVCQAQDQAWREKRRIRELEEMRARAGGIQVSTGSPAVSDAGSDPVARLRQAKALLDAKLISDSEYEAIKAKVVSSS